MSPLRRLRVLALTAALIGTACAGSDGGDATGNDATGDAPAATTAEAPATNDAPSTPAPDTASETETNATAPAIMQFTGTLVGGGELAAATLANKPTAFWFWSPT